MRKVSAAGFAAILILTVASCGSSIRSSVQSGPYQSDNPNRFGVMIQGVDGKLFTTDYINLEPGGHSLLVVADFGAGRKALPVAISLNVAPCMRYYLAAERTTGVSLTYKIVVDRAVRIEGCQTKAEKRAQAR